MTIAGAFWVGVLAARRLRDWGDGRRMLEEGETATLALPASAGASGGDESSAERIRGRVAQRIARQQPRALPQAPRQELNLETARVGDVVLVESTLDDQAGDYIVEGVVRLREGSSSTVVLTMVDGTKKRWLVGGEVREEWLLVEPRGDQGLGGEPPRNLQIEGRSYTLTRRGQSSVAGVGRHGRPEGTRLGTYLYQADSRHVLWLERWGQDVLVAVGERLDGNMVDFLPGS